MPIPILQTPKPTQPHPNASYRQLLNKTHESPRKTSTSLSSSSSSSSTAKSSVNSSPSSTLYSRHGLSGRDISKFFMDPRLMWNVASPPGKYRHYDHSFAPFDFETRPQAEFSSNQSELKPLSVLVMSEQPLRLPHDEGRTLDGPPLHSLPAHPYIKLKKSWDCIFQAGYKTLGPIQRASYAKELVWCGAWDDDAILDLVRVFIWRGSDFEAPEPVNFVALFAAEVSHAFEQQRMPDERFKRVLRESLMNTMTCCWHVPRDNHGDPLPFEGHRPVMLDRNPTISYKRHARQAVALCGFVGCMYKQDQLARTDLARCVRVICSNAKVVEHLHAIGSILTNAGTKLWVEAADLEEESNGFIAEIKRLRHKITDAWVLYLPRSRAMEKINQLVALVESSVAKLCDERAMAQIQACS